MSNWEEIKLIDLASNEINSFIDGDWIELPHITDTGIRLIQTGNIGRGVFKDNNKKFISEESFQILNCKEVKSGDILICRLADPIGRACRVPLLNTKCITSVDVTIFRADKNKYDDDFILQKLNTDEFLQKANEIAGGTTRQRISRSNLATIKILMPKKKLVQTKIAKILSTADAVIEKTQAAIAKYKAIKQGMLQDLFTRGIDLQTGKLRPRYEDAPELYKESKLGWIPREWEVELIGYCVDPIMSNVDKHIHADEIKVSLCNYMDVYSNRYLTRDISYSSGSVNASEYLRFSLQPQDVIITKDSETPDDIAVPSTLVEKIDNLICGYHLCILRSKDLNKLSGEFIMLQMQLYEINKQFANRANGSTRYGLTIDAIEECSLKIPNDINEQLEIAKRLKAIDNKLQTEETYLQKMQSIKKGLMEDLLSGRKQVKVSEEKTIKTFENA